MVAAILYPGSENNLPPPDLLFFFYIGDHFFIKDQDALVRIFSRKILGVAGAEPPGNFFTISGSKKSFAHFEIHHHVWNFTQVASFLVTFNKFPNCENIFFLPESIKNRGAGAEPPGNFLQF